MQNVTNIKPIYFSTFLNNNKNAGFGAHFSFDSYKFSGFNESILYNRGILDKNDSIDDFFSNISNTVFEKNSYESSQFLYYLKNGYISLSSSYYNDLSNPISAIALELNPNNPPSKNCAILEDYISKGVGVGLNFSEFNNPADQIKKINAYFKYREKDLKRPPAGIALLNVNHSKILDFINLKNNEDLKNWCFNLSVIIPNDFLNKVDNNENITLSDGSYLPARKIYHSLLLSMEKKGEPAIIFSDDINYNTDCCAVSELKTNEGLSVAHINLSKFFENGKINYTKLSLSTEILSKALLKTDKNAYIGILGYQALLDKLKLNYGENEANNVLENCMKVIRKQAKKQNIKLALSPTGTISKFLNTTPSIEPKNNIGLSYYKEIDTMACAQKYLDGNISKTIILKQNHDFQDIDCIIRYCFKKGIKEISVFKPSVPVS